MSLDDALSTAFARWADARAELGRLRARGTSEAVGKQLAASPEANALFQSILEQQAVCTRLWDELSMVAEERAEVGEARWQAEVQAQLQRSMLPPSMQAPTGDLPGSDADLE